MESLQIPTDNIFKFLTVLSLAGSILFGKLSYDSLNDYNSKAFEIEDKKGEYISELAYLNALDTVNKIKGFRATSVTYYYTYDKDQQHGSQYYYNDGKDTSKAFQEQLTEYNAINKKMAALKTKQLIADNYLRISSNNSLIYRILFGVAAATMFFLFCFFAFKWYNWESSQNISINKKP